MSRLTGKVAIITGAGSGIGWAAAKRFADEGALVVCADISGQERDIALAVHGGYSVSGPMLAPSSRRRV